MASASTVRRPVTRKEFLARIRAELKGITAVKPASVNPALSGRV